MRPGDLDAPTDAELIALAALGRAVVGVIDLGLTIRRQDDANRRVERSMKPDLNDVLSLVFEPSPHDDTARRLPEPFSQG